MATTTQIGGLKSFVVDGTRYVVTQGSDVTYGSRGTRATTIMGITGPAGYAEEAVACYIEAEILCTPEQYDTLAAKRNATVIASNAAGKTIKGSAMWFASDPTHAVNAGTATVRFEGAKVDV